MTAVRKKRKMSSPPCEACGAACCRYVAMEIDRPRSNKDYDTIRWYLLHENVSVFIDHDGDWFVEFKTVCRELDDSGRCRIYGERPWICREHGNDNLCEYFDTPYVHSFSTPEELDAYRAARRRKKAPARMSRTTRKAAPSG